MFKKAYEFSFSWIFTILIGAFIIFLAIYIAIQFLEVSRVQEETETAKQIGILLNPIETTLEQSKVSVIQLRKETTIINNCLSPNTENAGIYGSQKITAKVKSRLGEEWTEKGGFSVRFPNKYLFSSQNITSSNKIYLLSKPFKYPFKIADIIIAWSDKEKYCFDLGSITTGSAQAKIKKEIDDLGLKDKNIYYKTSSVNNCPSDPGIKKVCFGTSTTGCDIIVQLIPPLNAFKVTRSSPTSEVYAPLSFDSTDQYPLLYAAIFSDPEIYECQIKRLSARAKKIAELYEEKDTKIRSDGCTYSGPSTFKQPIRDYISAIESIINPLTPSPSSKSLANAYNDAKNVVDNNSAGACKIF